MYNGMQIEGTNLVESTKRHLDCDCKYVRRFVLALLLSLEFL